MALDPHNASDYNHMYREHHQALKGDYMVTSGRSSFLQPYQLGYTPLRDLNGERRIGRVG